MKVWNGGDGFIYWLLAFIRVLYVAQVLSIIFPLKLIYSQIDFLYYVLLLTFSIDEVSTLSKHSLVQIVNGHLTGAKPLLEAMMTQSIVAYLCHQTVIYRYHYIHLPCRQTTLIYRKAYLQPMMRHFVIALLVFDAYIHHEFKTCVKTTSTPWPLETGQEHYAFIHDDVIKWENFLRYWSSVRGIHRSSVSSPHKGQWRGALMFSLICAWINDWVNSRDAGNLRHHRAHYDVTVMQTGPLKL